MFKKIGFVGLVIGFIHLLVIGLAIEQSMIGVVNGGCIALFLIGSMLVLGFNSGQLEV